MNYQAKTSFAQQIKMLQDELSDKPCVAQKLKDNHPLLEINCRLKSGFKQAKGGWPRK